MRSYVDQLRLAARCDLDAARRYLAMSRAMGTTETAHDYLDRAGEARRSAAMNLRAMRMLGGAR